MAIDQKERINLAALQQNDPYIESIVETAGQVALYNFNAEANEWEKTDVQGTMFIYTSLAWTHFRFEISLFISDGSAAPLHGFIIMNRLSMHNFTEPITKEMEFQRNDPFLLYKNADSIHGIWFYNKDLCRNVAKSLEQLVRKLAVRTQRGPKQRTKSLGDYGGGMTLHKEEEPAGGAIDIMQMLSKAQHEYNQTKSVATKSESQVIRPIPMKVEGQSSLGDSNLAVAQVKGQQHENSQPGASPRQFKRSTSVQETPRSGPIEEAVGASTSEQVPPLLKQLFSQSDSSQGKVAGSSDVKTVESLERLHVADIEGEDPQRLQLPNESGKQPIDNLLQLLSHSEEQSTSKRSPLTPHALQTAIGSSSSLTSGHDVDPQLVSHEAPHRIASKGLNPPLMVPLKTTPHEAFSIAGLPRDSLSSAVRAATASEVGAGGDTGMNSAAMGPISPTEGTTVPTSPQTIPASFTPSKLLTPSSIQKTPSSGLLVPMAMTSKDPSSTSRISPVPTLTKEQFKEAYIFMLQNDSEFVGRLYDAYLQVQSSKPKT